MAKKKSIPEKVEDLKICELCGKQIKKEEPYFRHGASYSHDKCHADILKYGKIGGR